MINLDKFEKDIFHIQIFEPRVEGDEEKFFNFLNEAVSKESFSLAIEVSGDKSFSPEAKKELNIWFKNNKDKLGSSCLGFARVTRDHFSQYSKTKEAMSAALPCPYELFETFDEAKGWFNTL